MGATTRWKDTHSEKFDEVIQKLTTNIPDDERTNSRDNPPAGREGKSIFSILAGDGIAIWSCGYRWAYLPYGK